MDIRFIFLSLLLTLAIGQGFIHSQDWMEEEEAKGEPVRKEVIYQSYGRASGFRSHKWQIKLSQSWGARVGMYLIKNETMSSTNESHLLGLHGSRNFKRVGVRGSYALRDRSLSGGKGRNFISGGLRLSPFDSLDLLLDYDRIQEEFVTGAEDVEKETLSGGVRLNAFNALRMRVFYAGQNRMKVRVSYRW